MEKRSGFSLAMLGVFVVVGILVTLGLVAAIGIFAVAGVSNLLDGKLSGLVHVGVLVALVILGFHWAWLIRAYVRPMHIIGRHSAWLRTLVAVNKRYGESAQWNAPMDDVQCIELLKALDDAGRPIKGAHHAA